MKIDITPIIEIANETDSQIIKAREIEALYQFRYSDGEALTIKFDSKELSEFKPNHTVSETIKLWEEGVKHKVRMAEIAIKTKLHPTKTFERTIMEQIKGMDGIVRDFPTDKTETVKCKLDSQDIRNYKFTLKNLRGKLDDIKFIKIV